MTDNYAEIARIEEERSLTLAYRRSRTTRQPEGQGLNDLYVRFFRMAERRIVQMTGCGIVCFISNYSWLDGLSHPAMRDKYREVFDSIRIDSLNGDRDRTGKVTGLQGGQVPIRPAARPPGRYECSTASG